MFEMTIQSPHGMGELDAVFEARSVSYSENSSSNYSYGSDQESMGYENTNTNNNINYEMYYWVSAQSRLDYMADDTSDNKPMTWQDEGNTNFHANNLDSSYDALSIEEKAEKHCEEVTLA